MDHAIYTAMGAASQTLNQQAVTASNLANASTPVSCAFNALRAVPVEGLPPTRTLVTAFHAGRRHDARSWMSAPRVRWMLPFSRTAGLAVCKTVDGGEGHTRNGNIRERHRAADDSGASGYGRSRSVDGAGRVRADHCGRRDDLGVKTRATRRTPLRLSVV